MIMSKFSINKVLSTAVGQLKQTILSVFICMRCSFFLGSTKVAREANRDSMLILVGAGPNVEMIARKRLSVGGRLCILRTIRAPGDPAVQNEEPPPAAITTDVDLALDSASFPQRVYSWLTRANVADRFNPVFSVVQGSDCAVRGKPNSVTPLTNSESPDKQVWFGRPPDKDPSQQVCWQISVSFSFSDIFFIF